MKTATAPIPLKTTAGWEHITDVKRDENGDITESTLVCRHMNISFPDLPPLPMAPASTDTNCIKAYKKKLDDWLNAYKRELDYYEILCHYDEARMQYVYKHRHDDIPERYRTGDPIPTSITEALREIAKLKIRGG